MVFFFKKKKHYSVVKFSNGSIGNFYLAHGNWLGDVISFYILSQKYWFNKLPGNIVLLKLLKKKNIFFNLSNKNKKIIFAKAAGTFCQLLEFVIDNNFCEILLPSGTKKIINTNTFVIAGRNNGLFNKFENPKKAGHLLIIGGKSMVRGVAKNPVDHPHGGRTKTNSPEVSPWGWVTKHGR